MNHRAAAATHGGGPDSDSSVGQGCSEVDIADGRIRSSASALKFGTASYGGFRNIHAENLTIHDTFRSAVAIETVDGGTIGPRARASGQAQGRNGQFPTRVIPALDNTDRLRQARHVNTPPILSPTVAAAKPRRKSHKKLIIFSIIGVIGLAVAMFFGLRKKEPIVTVQTEKVGRHTITETVIANGKVYPVLQVHISAEVSGEIIELRVKEGQFVRKGDPLLKINPKTPLAYLNQSKASYESSRSSVTTATANLEKAEAEFKRNKELFDRKLISDSDFIGFKVALDIARAQLQSAGHSVELAKASVDSAQDSLDKTAIAAPLDGTITKLNSQLGERVLGTVQNAGTEIMTISDLSQMEARVDIGEMDIVLLQAGQKTKLEVDSFKDKKFAGVVTDVANSSEGLNARSAASTASSSATQFEVRIRLLEGDQFRPGMSVGAEIETRTRTNVLAAPYASVTARILKKKTEAGKTNSLPTNVVGAVKSETNSSRLDKKPDEKQKPVEVVFIVEGNQVKTVPVKIGISDDNFWEITEGLKEGDEIVTGSYHAISKDLDDGKKIVKGVTVADANLK